MFTATIILSLLLMCPALLNIMGVGSKGAAWWPARSDITSMDQPHVPHGVCPFVDRASAASAGLFLPAADRKEAGEDSRRHMKHMGLH